MVFGQKHPATRIFVGTVVRGAPVRQGGEIIRVDWDAKRISKRREVFPSEPDVDMDSNPRGNTRGCRGIVLVGDCLLFVNFHTVEMADHDFNTRWKFSHSLFAGLHEIFLSPDRLLLAATAIDSVHELHLESLNVVRTLSPRNHEKLQKIFGIEPLLLEAGADARTVFLGRDHTKEKSHLHLNAVAVAGGRLLGLFNRFGAICDLETSEILVQDEKMVGAHNIVPLTDTACLVNDTRGARLLVVDLERGKLTETIELRDYGVVREIESKAVEFTKRHELPDKLTRPLFVRGLARSGDSIFIGLSPATVLEIDANTKSLLSCMEIDSDPRVCVHGLAAARI